MPLGAEDLEELVRLLEQQPQWRETLRAALWKDQDLVDWLRDHLPRLLREDPRLSAEVLGILAQTLSPRADLVRVLEEVRLLREDFARAIQAMDERFRALQQDTGGSSFRPRSSRGTKGSWTSCGWAWAARGGGSVWVRTVGTAIVEEFAGAGPLAAERLVLRDDAGEVSGVPGQPVEFDAFVHDSRRFLVEVKGFAEPDRALRARLGGPFRPQQDRGARPQARHPGAPSGGGGGPVTLSGKSSVGVRSSVCSPLRPCPRSARIQASNGSRSQEVGPAKAGRSLGAAPVIF